eukprot:CAMPEP_0174261746 /NCGR_PEP_ID=MMETSP0439-20130205/12030_1 /TAXON_ID=0 /ORGANISM="Stereomyxa ramosa, Strain Chinc5" /LENGTH=157 /DNA_ID=CAMNT_0015346293 /DNA_START=21 /DNA_END=494 /DNA_ORIENTATION=-
MVSDNFVYDFTQAFPTYLLGGVILVGGVMGFRKKRSIPSLVAGVGYGSLFGVSGYLIQDKEKRLLGKTTGLLGSGLLASTMIQRFRTTRAIFPAGLLAFSGCLSTAYHSYIIVKPNPRTRKEKHLREIRRELAQMKTGDELKKHTPQKKKLVEDSEE